MNKDCNSYNRKINTRQKAIHVAITRLKDKQYNESSWNKIAFTDKDLTIEENIGIGKGLENIFSATSATKIGKPRQIFKNTKYIHFFHNFKHIKQHWHQINTLAHKYRKSTDIYHVVMPNIIWDIKVDTESPMANYWTWLQQHRWH